MKKANEISQNPYYYKNLRGRLSHWRRVHIDKHFVLTYSIVEEKKLVILKYFDHHDKIYHR